MGIEDKPLWVRLEKAAKEGSDQDMLRAAVVCFSVEALESRAIAEELEAPCSDNCPDHHDETERQAALTEIKGFLGTEESVTELCQVLLATEDRESALYKSSLKLLRNLVNRSITSERERLDAEKQLQARLERLALLMRLRGVPN